MLLAALAELSSKPAPGAGGAGAGAAGAAGGESAVSGWFVSPPTKTGVPSRTRHTRPPERKSALKHQSHPPFASPTPEARPEP